MKTTLIILTLAFLSGCSMPTASDESTEGATLGRMYMTSEGSYAIEYECQHGHRTAYSINRDHYESMFTITTVEDSVRVRYTTCNNHNKVSHDDNTIRYWHSQ